MIHTIYYINLYFFVISNMKDFKCIDNGGSFKVNLTQLDFNSH